MSFPGAECSAVQIVTGWLSADESHGHRCKRVAAAEGDV